VALGVALIPDHGEVGAAVAAVIAECLLGALLLGALWRAAPDVSPRLGPVTLRIAPLAAAAAALLLVPGVNDAALTPLAVGLFAAGVVVTRALPPEVLIAFRSRLGGRPAG
jgi:O-antigen/teichoic acid export membrane protein